MIEVESKELLCVKCPVDKEWTLIEYCRGKCGYGDKMDDENPVCEYDKYIEKKHREFNMEDKEGEDNEDD